MASKLYILMCESKKGIVQFSGLMVDSRDNKTAQQEEGKKNVKETEPVKEYDFFVSISGTDSVDKLTEETSDSYASRKGQLEEDQRLSFFLPD